MSPNHKILLVSFASVALIGIVASIKFSGGHSSSTPLFHVSEQAPPLTIAATSSGSFLGSTSSSTQPSSSSPETAFIPYVRAAPEITAAAYLVGNVKTGQIYFDQDSSTPLPVASMSKLVTAIAATDTLTPTTIVTITQLETEVASDTSFLLPGEKFTAGELMYPLLLSSSNIAANALASTTNLSNFLELMSSYAWEVGASTAFFADPSGLSPHNIASARDMFALSRYLYADRPDILAITRIPEVDVSTTSDHGAHQFVSTHPFIADPRFIGGKTGRTPEAGETMLTILNINSQPIAFIVLGSQYGEREADTRLLISKFENMGQ